MKKILIGSSVVGMGLVSQAADFTALQTEIVAVCGQVAAVVTATILAGFGIYVLIWGARKIKNALSSAA